MIAFKLNIFLREMPLVKTLFAYFFVRKIIYVIPIYYVTSFLVYCIHFH